MPHYPPGAVGGERWGFDLAEIQMLHPTIWEGEFIKSPSIPVSERQLCSDLIKPKVKFPTLGVRIFVPKKNLVKSNPPPFPT